MKILVKITDGKRTYIEDVTEEEKESFELYSANGWNSGLTDFKKYTRSLPEFKLKTDLLEQYNTVDEKAHFIFGWCESFFQSDNVPDWMWGDGDLLRIEVIRED